jgi:hypothetical protein
MSIEIVSRIFEFRKGFKWDIVFDEEAPPPLVLFLKGWMSLNQELQAQYGEEVAIFPEVQLLLLVFLGL